MRQVFAGQDRKGYQPVTRSIRLGGHSTSIRLENAYWEILDEIAAAHTERAAPGAGPALQGMVSHTGDAARI